MPVLDRVRTDYPDTEAATYAGLRRAQALMFLHTYDEAIAAATPIVTANTGKIIACWAQCVVGQSLAFKGQTADGVRELWKVPGMLPNQTDLGPVNEAREVLGRVCEQYLVGHSDDLDAAQTIGLNSSDVGDKAKLLAILAAYRAREGDFPKARNTLARLSSECAGQGAELDWAKGEVALYCLDDLQGAESDKTEAAETLRLVYQALPAGHHSGARACLSLARYYAVKRDSANSVAALQDAKARFGSSANSAEINYNLARALLSAGRESEAVPLLQEVLDGRPTSGYAAPALYCLGTRSGEYADLALSALTRLAEGPYDRNWRGLAHWRLGTLHRMRHENAEAKKCYSEVIRILQETLAEQKADIGDWRSMLTSRLEIVQSELRGLDGGGAQ